MLLELTRGYSTVIDDCDYDRSFAYWLSDGTQRTFRICDLTWHVHTPKHTQYARAGYGTKPRFFVQMHRLLMEAPLDQIADHADRNGLNNRRLNLRLVTPLESRLNTRKKSAKNTYRGVYWNTREKRWYARITMDHKTTFLGSFTDEVLAAQAYDAAATRLHGSFAMLNFPLTFELEQLIMESPTELPLREYCEKYAATIFVRTQGPDGKWGPFSLAQLPAVTRDMYVLKWEREGRRPVRILGDDEDGVAQRTATNINQRLGD